MPKEIPTNAYAIIIGSMKSGTTSLFHYLAGHPQVCPSITKEPEFFSENQAHGIEVERYEDLFDFDPGRHRVALEASAGYAKFPQETEVARRIHEYGISPKFIYLVRDPFDRIVSHYNFSKNHLKQKGAEIDAPNAIHTSNYFLQLEQFRQFYPKERFLILDFDDLKNDPRRVLLTVYEFLGLTNDYLPEHFKVRNKTSHQHPVEALLKKRLGASIGRWPGGLKRLAKKAIKQALPNTKKTLTPAQKERIADALREGMYQFQEVYGFDVSKWGF